MLLINGWLLYRRHADQKSKPKKERMHLVDFTATAIVSSALVKQSKVLSSLIRKRGRSSVENKNDSSSSDDDEGSTNFPQKRKMGASSSIPGIRFDNIGHSPVHSESNKRFSLCGSHVRMKCIKCECYLCITKKRNCFLEYHRK